MRESSEFFAPGEFRACFDVTNQPLRAFRSVYAFRIRSGGDWLYRSVAKIIRIPFVGMAVSENCALDGMVLRSYLIRARMFVTHAIGVNRTDCSEFTSSR